METVEWRPLSGSRSRAAARAMNEYTVHTMEVAGSWSCQLLHCYCCYKNKNWDLLYLLRKSFDLFTFRNTLIKLQWLFGRGVEILFISCFVVVMCCLWYDFRVLLKIIFFSVRSTDYLFVIRYWNVSKRWEGVPTKLLHSFLYVGNQCEETSHRAHRTQSYLTWAQYYKIWLDCSF